MGVEKAVNRLMIVTAAFALAFGAGAYHFRNAPHAGAYEDELEISLCEYIDIDVLRLNVSVIPYDGDRIRISYINDLPLIIEKGDNSLSISESVCSKSSRVSPGKPTIMSEVSAASGIFSRI